MNTRTGLYLAVQYQSKSEAPGRDQCRRWITATRLAIEDARTCRLTLRFVDRPEQRALNARFRQRDYATNVLTFNYEAKGEVVADIVVCVPVTLLEARQQKKDPKAHFAHLVVHGVLHAHGFDHEHEPEAREMEAVEARILRRFHLSDPYL
jgi:probable rRNA maturation factor